jgi:hypothetical protein
MRHLAVAIIWTNEVLCRIIYRHRIIPPRYSLWQASILSYERSLKYDVTVSTLRARLNAVFEWLPPVNYFTTYRSKSPLRSPPPNVERPRPDGSTFTASDIAQSGLVYSANLLFGPIDSNAGDTHSVRPDPIPARPRGRTRTGHRPREPERAPRHPRPRLTRDVGRTR